MLYFGGLRVTAKIKNVKVEKKIAFIEKSGCYREKQLIYEENRLARKKSGEPIQRRKNEENTFVTI